MKNKTGSQSFKGRIKNSVGITADASQDCGHFVSRGCGGCSFLHIPYTHQLEAKREQVVDILKNAFRLLPAAKKPVVQDLVRAVVPSPEPMGYRASAKFCLQEDSSGNRSVGLYRQRSQSVVDTTGCPANVGEANDLVAALRADTSLLPAKFADHNNPVFEKNRLKFLTVRTSPASPTVVGSLGLIISHTGVDRQAMMTWVQKVGLKHLCVYETRLTKADGDNISGRSIDHLCGPETFPYQLNNQIFDISPVSFFQANHSLAAALIREATAFSRDGDVLLDLYGGFGAYSFAVADRFREIHVVDGNRSAINAASAHAKKNGITHLRTWADTCENFLEKNLVLETARCVSHVIVNPSRSGLSPRVITSVDPAALSQLKELHYISCNPLTFARDAKSLVGIGYTLDSLVPFDMFPQTEHVEVIGKFSVPRARS